MSVSIEEVIEHNGFFIGTPVGSSMWPILRSRNDTVVLRDEKQPEIFDVVLYRRENGQLVLHRCFGKDKNGNYRFCGDNQFRFEKGVSSDRIIGVAIAYYRGEEKRYFERRSYKAYVFFWSVLFPLRLPFVFCKHIAERSRRKNAQKRAGKA